MIFAYLILAHDFPCQLLKMVESLEGNSIYIFVHIDGKSDDSPFKKLLKDKVIFCKNRIDVYWGGFSQIQATVELLKTMHSEIGIPDYVHLLSGQDFPIKSNEYIFDFFNRFNGYSFIEYEKLPRHGWHLGGMDRIQYKWQVDGQGYEKADEFIIDQKESLIPDYIIPYGGSQWWSLHGSCIDFLLEQCKDGNKVYDFFKETLCSDEIFFQTLLVNSSYKDKLINTNVRDINWSMPGSHPHIWNMDDIELLRNSSCLFARKFKGDMLDELILIATDRNSEKDIIFDPEAPDISVVMPVYNSERYLIEAMDSVLNQTYTNFEFIITDDGSTDKSLEIISCYRDERIKLIRNEHDYIRTLNIGLSASKGKYIARMDTDDVMYPERLEKQFHFMENNPDIAVSGTQANIIGSMSGEILLDKHPDKIRLGLLLNNMLIHPATMIRKDFLIKNELQYDEDFIYAEDYKLWAEISKKGNLANIDQKLLLYRCHHNQLSTQKSKNQDTLNSVIQFELAEFYISKLDKTKSLSEIAFRFWHDLIKLNDNGFFSTEYRRIIYKLIESLFLRKLIKIDYE